MFHRRCRRDAWNTGTATWYIHDSSRADANPFVISDMVLDDATDVHCSLVDRSGNGGCREIETVVENCEKYGTAGIAPTVSEL